MGTDIHLYTEVRDATGKWQSADKWREPEDGYWSVDHIWTGRSYDTFSILAGVRNGSGFAGVPTGEGFNPIAMPRGLPVDASPEVIDRVHVEHTPSWLTLAEMLAYDWTQETSKCGWMGVRDFARILIGDKPNSWAGGIGGPNIVKITEIEARAQIKALGLNSYKLLHDPGEQNKLRAAFGANTSTEPTFNDRLQIHASWKVKYHEAAADFLATAMPKLWRLGRPEDVRIVFHFDS